MKLIPINKIKIAENRQRQEFDPDKLMELSNSIAARGLMHPIVLRQDGDDVFLVAGERRLRAMNELHWMGTEFSCDSIPVDKDTVPYTMLGELDELEAEEAELDENLKRADLTWQEHAAAVEKLHKLRQRQTADAQGVSPAVPDHTVADTAEELTGRRDGHYQDTVRQELIVAKHLDNPDVAKAKNVKEAYKVLKRQEEAEQNRELAQVVGASFNVDLHELHNMNCLEWMGKPENEATIDVILTDPPYGMNAQNFGDGAGRLAGIEHHYDDSYEHWQKLMVEWSHAAFYVCKPQAHAYVFCDIDNFVELKSIMHNAGWYVFRTPLINHKQNSGRVPLPDKGPRRQYEILLYAIKGDKKVNHIYPDVISTTADENMSHGAQKPVAVFENLLKRSVQPGDVVLDSFAGTGPIFPAAHTFKCKAIGIEMNPEYYGLSLKRLNSLALDDQLGLEEV